MGYLHKILGKRHLTIEYLTNNTNNGRCIWVSDLKTSAKFICSHRNTFYSLHVWDSEQGDAIFMELVMGNNSYQYSSSDRNKNGFAKCLTLYYTIKHSYLQ